MSSGRASLPAKRIQMAGSEEPAKVGEGTNGGLWIGPPLHRLLKNTSVALRPGSLGVCVCLSLLGREGTCVYQGRERTATGSPGREYATEELLPNSTRPPRRQRLSLSLSLPLFSLVCLSRVGSILREREKKNTMIYVNATEK